MEDVEDDAILLAHALRHGGFEVSYERVDTAANVAAALDREAWDLVISDHGMPGFTGTQALAIVREKAPDVPFIFVSGTIGEGIAVAAMRVGAQDYVMKGDLTRLAPAVARELHDAEGRRRTRVAEEELRATSDVLRSVVAASPLAIIATDLSGRVTLWNPAAERLFGWTEAEVLGRENPTIPAHALIEHDARSAAALRGDALVDLEARRQRKDGSLVDVSISVATTRDRLNEPDGMTVVLQDLTERKQLQAQFLQAQKMETIGQLTGGVAHDFNNLLTIVTSYSELLLDGVTPGDQRALDLGEIRKAARAAAALTRQLLAFSRPQPVHRGFVDLNEVVTGASTLLTRMIGESIALKLRLHPRAGVVEVDAIQLEQVTMNLVVNARDAMPEGGTIILETRQASADEAYFGRAPPSPSRGYAMLAVSDTGIGMDEATQARIFEPFFTTKGESRGTGLGLATVEGIVKQHEGVIRVSSTPGEGTTFRIYLPLAVAEHQPLKTPALSLEDHGGSATMLVPEQ